MATPLNHAAIEELLGAYALDAVDDDERDAVERHLAECPRCRAEVTEHREVAALLANAGLPAPDGLWDRLAGVLDAPPPQLALAPVPPPRRGRLRRHGGAGRRRGRANRNAGDRGGGALGLSRYAAARIRSRNAR